MSREIPLSDTDRWDWLIRLREAAKKALIAGELGVVISCSALKRKYRDVLRILGLERPDASLLFVYLCVDHDLLLRRIQSRQGHYMKDSMLKSQLESLEPPSCSEPDILTVDANRDLEDVCGFAVSTVRGGRLAEHCTGLIHINTI
jgi:gluconokinase